MRMQAGGRELFITFRVSRSDYFRRDGADIHTDCWVGLTQAVLGGAIRIQVRFIGLGWYLIFSMFSLLSRSSPFEGIESPQPYS